MDDKPVAVKLIPKDSIMKWVTTNGEKIPFEFDLHQRAAGVGGDFNPGKSRQETLRQKNLC